METQCSERHADAFPVETSIDRVRAIGDLLVSCGGQPLNANTLPTIGALLFDIADNLESHTGGKA